MAKIRHAKTTDLTAYVLWAALLTAAEILLISLVLSAGHPLVGQQALKAVIADISTLHQRGT